MKRLMVMIGIITSLVFTSQAGAKDPDKMVRGFLNMLQANKVSEAYDGLFENSGIPVLRPNDVDAIKRKTTGSLLVYGDILGYEKVEERTFGTSVVRLVYILKSEKSPIVWVFNFYKPDTKWFLGNVEFNDQYRFPDGMK